MKFNIYPKDIKKEKEKEKRVEAGRLFKLDVKEKKICKIFFHAN